MFDRLFLNKKYDNFNAITILVLSNSFAIGLLLKNYKKNILNITFLVKRKNTEKINNWHALTVFFLVFRWYYAFLTNVRTSEKLHLELTFLIIIILFYRVTKTILLSYNNFVKNLLQTFQNINFNKWNKIYIYLLYSSKNVRWAGVTYKNC